MEIITSYISVLTITTVKLPMNYYFLYLKLYIISPIINDTKITTYGTINST